MSATLHRRFDVSLRVLLAIGGGYAFATVASAALARTLPLPPAQAVMTALLLGFLLHALAAIAVFAARTAWRATLWVALPTIGLAAWVWPLGGASPV